MRKIRLPLPASHPVYGMSPAASDHRPIITDIIFNQPAGKIFRTEPYLQNPVGNGITVMWQTTVPTYSWVEYGTDKEHLQKARTIVDGQVICNESAK